MIGSRMCSVWPCCTSNGWRSHAANPASPSYQRPRNLPDEPLKQRRNSITAFQIDRDEPERLVFRPECPVRSSPCLEHWLCSHPAAMQYRVTPRLRAHTMPAQGWSGSVTLVADLEVDDMSEIAKPEAISRRKALALAGLGAVTVLGLGLAASSVAVSEAEAQTVGMDRRQDRRGGRQDRRQDRRTGRHDRRQNRRQ